MTDHLASARKALKQFFSYDRFKPAQEAVLTAALAGDDVLAVLQTGYGKSVCFQIPAMLKDGCAIVVTPLIALMKDQVDNANKRGIPASFVNSHLDPEEIQDRLDNFVGGAYRLLYVAPERLNSKPFRDALQRATVSYIVVDEAHCASMYGHDFRPAYSRIHEISSLLWEATETRPPIIAVTATATKGIEDDIATALGMNEEYVRVVGDPVRHNLSYEVRKPYGSDFTEVRNIMRNRIGILGRHLVYASTQKGATMTAQMMNELGHGRVADAYHGGMTRDERTRVQDEFVAGKLRLVCATNAFGMGIDVPDIRTVLHMGVPGSIEAYVQESGRAGRDGQPAAVILVCSQFAEDLQRQFIDNNNPPIASYGAVWEWLLEHTTKKSMVALSANDIGEELGLDGAGCSTVLNVLEGHRLVHREYHEGGAPVTVDVESLVAFKAPSRELKGTIAYLLERANETDDGAFGMDRTEAPFVAQVPVKAFRASLATLEAAGVITVGKTFTGKTTRVLDREAVLHDVLPVERLEQKRARDLARFDAMLDYTKLKAVEERRQFVQDYFLKEEDGPSRKPRND